MLYSRSFITGLHNVRDGTEQGVIAVRAVESVVTIRPARNKLERAQLAKFILDCAQGKSAHPHQLAYITFLLRRCEEQSQYLSAALGKQCFQNAVLFLHNFKSKSNLTG